MLSEIEFGILNFIQENLRCGFLDWLLVALTTLGNNGFIWILICIFSLFSKKYQKMGILMAVALLIGFILGNVFLKPLIARERPSWINAEILLLIKNPHDFSFPSGHTLSSFAAASVIACFDKKMGTAALFLAALIAFSRLYLYVHFPTDVLSGAVLGSLIGMLVSYLGKRVKMKREL